MTLSLVALSGLFGLFGLVGLASPSVAEPSSDAPDSFGLVDPASGMWHLFDGGVQVSAFYFGNPGDLPFTGDWNCDGVDTPGLYRQADGFVYLRGSNTQGAADIAFYFGDPGDVPIAGDFDADGCDTVSIYRPSEARFYIVNTLGLEDGGLGAADYSFIFGNVGDKPFIGDFNGDGRDTVGLHRESTGHVYYRNTNTSGIADSEFVFGNPGDRFVAGDWTGTGADAPGVFRPSNTTMYLRYENSQGNADESWNAGQSTWLPVAGKFASLSPPNTAWSQPLVLRDNRTGEPRVDSDGSLISVAWQDWDGYDESESIGAEVFLRQSVDGGSTWEPPLDISATPSISEWQVDVAVADGVTMATWYEGGTNDVLLTRVVGSEVSKTRFENPTGNYTLAPRIVGTGDHFYYVSGDNASASGSIPYILFAASHDSGRTWTTLRGLSGGPFYERWGSLPTVAANGTNVIILWRGRPEVFANQDIYATRSTDGGATWGNKVDLSNTGGIETPPEIASRGSTAVAAWYRMNSHLDQEVVLVTATSSDFGLSWGAPRDIAVVPGAGLDRSDRRPVVVARSDRFEIIPQSGDLRFASVDGAMWTVGPPPYGTLDRVRDGDGSAGPATILVGGTRNADGLTIIESLD